MPTSVHELTRGWRDYSAQLAGRCRVLAVEDEAVVRQVFAMVLEPGEFECVLAASGEQALELFAGAPADALLTDKNLPGINGLELIRRVQQIDKDCEAVLITGFASVDSVLAAIDLRAADYLCKPVEDIEIIPATLRRALRRRRRRLLTQRMVADFRQAVGERAEDEDWTRLAAARRRMNDFRSRLTIRRHVLFADEDVQASEVVAAHLKSQGYLTALESHSAAALERSAKAHANVIVIGDKLRDTSGLELFARLVQEPGHPEVILSSAKTQLKDVLHAINRGASGYTMKPITDLRAFARSIERACLDHFERLFQHKLVEELTVLFNSLGGRDGHDDIRADIQTALEGFDTAGAQVALRVYETTTAGESEWSPSS
ncbi:MAG: response regulator [Deltaproteobacteria bacterium]|nr:response regulator [Deltaproteobacteria bacterium]